MPDEFDIIRTCFDQPGLAAEQGDVIRLGIGDDCALLAIPAGNELALTMDTLVESVHFPAGAPADLLAWRALAINLSDLAAMGAKPVGFTLSLTTPAGDAGWLRTFSSGLKACAGEFGCPLMGGDTNRGPLSITIQAHGLVPSGKAITRGGAAPGDRLYVSGSLGGAALAIRKLLEGNEQSAGEASCWQEIFYRPTPRLQLGMAMAGIVSAGIDISDGLLADLGHICERSGVGATVRLGDIPLAPDLCNDGDSGEALALAATGGDDYELLLAVSQEQEEALVKQGAAMAIPLQRIGEIIAGSEVTCLDGQGEPVSFTTRGYEHFS